MAATLGLCFVFTPPAHAVLSLGISTPSVALTNFAPGATATGSGTVVVTAVPSAAWTLTAVDSAHAGHLVPAATGCVGDEAQTAGALSVTANGTLGGTVSTGAVTIANTAKTVATGSATDTITLAYSLLIGRTEAMSTGCQFSTTVTYTVQ